jgi:hypothetical protein
MFRCCHLILSSYAKAAILYLALHSVSIKLKKSKKIALGFRRYYYILRLGKLVVLLKRYIIRRLPRREAAEGSCRRRSSWGIVVWYKFYKPRTRRHRTARKDHIVNLLRVPDTVKPSSEHSILGDVGRFMQWPTSPTARRSTLHKHRRTTHVILSTQQLNNSNSTKFTQIHTDSNNSRTIILGYIHLGEGRNQLRYMAVRQNHTQSLSHNMASLKRVKPPSFDRFWSSSLGKLIVCMISWFHTQWVLSLHLATSPSIVLSLCELYM